MLRRKSLFDGVRVLSVNHLLPIFQIFLKLRCQVSQNRMLEIDDSKNDVTSRAVEGI